MSIEAAARHEHDRGVETKLFEIMKDKGKDRVTSAVIADALQAKDDVVVHLIDQAVDGMAIAVAIYLRAPRPVCQASSADGCELEPALAA